MDRNGYVPSVVILTALKTIITQQLKKMVIEPIMTRDQSLIVELWILSPIMSIWIDLQCLQLIYLPWMFQSQLSTLDIFHMHAQQ